MDTTLKGKRVRLINMNDLHTNLVNGDEGTIQFIDGIGQIHVNWDNGSTLALIPGEDEYKILRESIKNKITIDDIARIVETVIRRSK